MNESKYPLVIVAAPQHESKAYCQDEWIENVKNFTYPNFEVFLSDNSSTDANKKELKKHGIKCHWVKPKKKEHSFETINRSHAQCAEYALKKNAALLHLETDVFPPINVIERLMAHKKLVVGGYYDIFYGSKRKLMVQTFEEYGRHVRAFRTAPFVEEQEPLFISGELEQVYHVGLGCVLIQPEVLRRVPFRVNMNYAFHSDTWFANDCFVQKIPIYCDTSLSCKHKNNTWLGKIKTITE